MSNDSVPGPPSEGGIGLPGLDGEARASILEATIGTTTDGVLVVGRKADILFANERFLEMWGLGPELTEARDLGALHRHVRAKIAPFAPFPADLEGLVPGRGEGTGTVRCTDGRVVEWSYRDLRSDGAATGWVWRFRDVTDHANAEEALRASEERYRRLVELSPDAIAVHMEGRFVFANPAAAHLLGADSPDELIGRRIMDIVHPDYRALVQERARRETEEGQVAPWLEEKFVRLDGSVVDVEVAGIPFSFEGRPAGQVIARDISERKRAQAAMALRSEYLTALHETTLNLMNRLGVEDVLQAMVTRAAALVGSEHGYIYLLRDETEEIEVLVASGAFRDWVGLRMKPGEGVAGKVWVSGEALIIQDYDAWEGRSDEFPNGIFHAVVGLPLKSGSEVVGVIGVAHVESSRTFTSEEVELLERFAGLASVALDNARLYTAARQELAERERAEDELLLAESRYRTLVERIPAITYTAGFGFEPWPYVSPHIEAILGFTPGEWMADGELWYTRIHPDDRERAMAEEGRTRDTGEPLLCEYRMLSRDGRVVWIRDEAVMVEVEGTRVMQGVMFDITERKRAEEELERALEREREASGRLRSLDEMKNTFLHAVSHELRTPLSAVLGFSLTLDRDDIELTVDDRRDIVRRIASNAKKLDRLLSDLLDLDRLDRGIVEPRRRPTDLKALIGRTVDSSGVTELRPVRVDVDPVIAPLDGPKVERMVENLLVNAARHTPRGSPIWVRVRREGPGILIAVEDEGRGVPEDIREEIFEPFRQGPDAPPHAPGVGIGLSLVARFAALHGGRAWCEDRQGGGASFRIYLPDEA